jgi:hypothetical protein
MVETAKDGEVEHHPRVSTTGAREMRIPLDCESSRSLPQAPARYSQRTFRHSKSGAAPFQPLDQLDNVGDLMRWLPAWRM